jgi:signal transduction histidine kinase
VSPADEERESTVYQARRRLFVQGLGIRVALCIFFAAVMVVIGTGELISRRSALSAAAILLGLALVNVPFWLIGRRAGFPTRQFSYHWAIDILALTLFIRLGGGVDTPYCALAYSAMVTFAAVNASRRIAMRLATLAVVAFGALNLAEGFGLVQRQVGMWEHHYSTGALAFGFVTASTFIYCLAWISGSLADNLKAANASLERFSARVEEQNRTLEHRVAERTGELEQAHKEIEDLVHIVTHDLKNVSVAATETARKLVTRESGGLSPRGMRYAEHLLDDARSMSRMLENLLSLFREAEPEADKREWVDVEEIVRRVFIRLQHELEAKEIEIEVGPLPTVFAEPAKIQHVFDNLIDNACKYVGDTRPARVVVGAERREGTIVYFVRDNGIGIDARHMERIFQLYHRSPNQNVNGVDQAGHGVGLAIVKRIVERYGGAIQVESEPQRGSTFLVTFPAHQEEARA